VRVVPGAPRAPTLDVFVDGVLRQGRLTYGTSSDYLNVPVGTADVAVRSILTGEPIADQATPVAAERDVTVLAVGIYPQTAMLPLADDNTAPPADSARLRIVHVAPNGGAFDVYVVPAGAAIAGAPTLPGFAYTDASPYLTLAAGSWRIAATLPGTAALVLDTGEQLLRPGEVKTAVVLDDSKGNRARGILLFSDRAVQGQAQAPK
jgi:hypothetical protein